MKELPQDIFVQDPAKDLDEEKFQSQVDQFIQKPINPMKIDQLVMGDTIIQWIQLKLKKKTEIIRKVVEEEWNNVESVKQIEKLENSCITYMKYLIEVIDKISSYDTVKG